MVIHLLSNKRRSKLAGVLIASMMLGTIASGLLAQVPSWPAGVCAWIAGILLVDRVSRRPLLQICFLSLIGALSLAVAVMLGGTVLWGRLLDSNVGILSMLAAVSFLRLVSLEDPADALPLARGLRAFTKTLLSVAIFGGFINISAPLLIADRISRAGGLSLFAAQSITRVFPGGASWSPFFAGMAVVLTYVPEARFMQVMQVGLPFAALGILYVIIEARLRYRDQLAQFEGYPMTPANLWIPLTLTVLVIIGRALFPQVPILVIICLAALTATILFSCTRKGFVKTAGLLRSHIGGGLSGMAGEMLLFLAAGVLAVGLGALVSAAHVSLPMTGTFNALAAGLLLAAIIVTSALGIHPVISITVSAPLLAPIHPDPVLLAVTYVFGWSLGTCTSPLSGINLIFQGRFGISSGRVAMRNWPFAAAMSLVGLLFFQIVSIVRDV